MGPRSAPRPREVLPADSRYQLLVKIASGGMATVYVGRSTAKHGVSRLFAIKRAHEHLSDDAVFRKMFVAEAQLAARIHHPNVVAVQDVEELDEELLLVMDYVEGTALVNLRPLAEDVTGRARLATRILLDACAGLHAAHELADERGKPLGIVHRDVSPQNILVGLDGITRIADFGIAKSTGSAGPSTITGAIKGKVGYMAPEYVTGGKVDRRLDVFAMGVVLWECLTGVRLYRATTSEAELVAAVAACAIERPTLIEGSIPAALEAVVLRALEKDPAARFATVRELADALESVAREHALLASHAEVAARVEEVAGRDLARRKEILADRMAPLAGESDSSIEIAEPTRTRTLDGPLSERTADVGGTLSVPPPETKPLRARPRTIEALVALLVIGVVLGVGIGFVRKGGAPERATAGGPTPSASSPPAPADSVEGEAALSVSPSSRPVVGASAPSARAAPRDSRAHAPGAARPHASSDPRTPAEPSSSTTPAVRTDPEPAATPTSTPVPTPGRAPPNPYRREGTP